jgi:hypothetical protein
MPLPPRPGLLRAGFLLGLAAGCATTTPPPPPTPPGRVALRSNGTPGPEPCPEEALKAMRYLRIGIGEGASIQLDLNQDRVPTVTLYDGPIESMLEEPLGRLGAGTRLYGQVWTRGPQVIIRYYSAQEIGEEEFPLCGVIRVSKGKMARRPDSPPDAAMLDFSEADVWIVNAFR